ncbi:MAG: thymidylate kinase [Acidobacteria bacterium OLB17]|nr:MAG: thymidylate kinase [Acidobacteria bacterium OLB17]MCZ2390158.1 dTMP kinase [Acidobacteriota bacterium]
MKGSFITFEGIDGSGKTTQLERLAESLRHSGRDVLITCEPGGTPLGRELRKAFLETKQDVEPLAELLLFAADRAQHVQHLIRPALAEGKIVISDRYADATTAYQGAGRGFDLKLIENVTAIATGGLKPDLTLFFDIEPQAAVDRMEFRAAHKKNRMDLEPLEFYERVRDAYLRIAAAEPERFRVIDAGRGIDEIAAETLEAVTEMLDRV